MKYSKGYYLLLVLLLSIIVIYTLLGPETFINIPSQSCHTLHGPSWINNSCWLDSVLVGLLAPLPSRQYFYPFFLPQEKDGPHIVEIKNKFMTIIEAMFSYNDEHPRAMKANVEVRDQLGKYFQGSHQSGYQKIQGFVPAGDYNYSHLFLSDLFAILDVPPLPHHADRETYLLPPPTGTDTIKWNSLSSMPERSHYPLQSPHPYLIYRTELTPLQTIPNTITLPIEKKTQNYELVSIVILAHSHYITYVKCTHNWFAYDGEVNDNPITPLNFSQFDQNTSTDQLYAIEGLTSAWNKLWKRPQPKYVFDPRHATLANNGVDYNGDSLLIYMASNLRTDTTN